MATALIRVKGHLHAVPGGEVFVYDLPARQVAHSTCNLNGHVNQVLLRDRLEGNERERETMCCWETETGKTQKGGSGDVTFQICLLCQIVLYIFLIERGSKMGVTYTKTISVFKCKCKASQLKNNTCYTWCLKKPLKGKKCTVQTWLVT